ncbi:type II secretion system protein [bacterium]|nr:type II secretion system protein [bacterium]
MRFKAFTLAEVLITLGIIGVVSAMTIPTLLSNTNSQHFRAMFKKTLSTLNQAGRMAQARHDINYGLTMDTCGENAKTENLETTYSFCAILNGTLSGAHYIGKPQNYTIEMYDYTFTPENMIAYSLSDGAMVMFYDVAGGCSGKDSPQCLGFIDVNGKGRPNKLISCDDPQLNVAEVGSCKVSADNKHMTDVYPVLFMPDSVEPASPAARAVILNTETETAGVLNRPNSGQGNTLCGLKVAGCSACNSCFRNGFDKASLMDKAQRQGVDLGKFRH